MLSILIIIIFIFITLISFFGDYNKKEIEKQKQDWERIIGCKYE